MPGAVSHSDQGFQYTHKSYQEQLGKLQLRGSHSRKGNCRDNACVESFFSHLKAEAFAGKPIVGKDKTIALIEEHIRFYNTERFQKRLGQLSPAEYREKLAALSTPVGAFLPVYLTGGRPLPGDFFIPACYLVLFVSI